MPVVAGEQDWGVIALSGGRRRLFVEINLHFHRTQRRYEMRLPGKDDTGICRLEHRFTMGIQDRELQTSFQNADQPPDPGLGIVPFAQGCRHRVFAKIGVER